MTMALGEARLCGIQKINLICLKGKCLLGDQPLFNRQVVRRNRDRASTDFSDFDFLFREAAAMLADRLEDIKREFPVALDLGCHTGQVAAVTPYPSGIGTLIQCDLSPAMVSSAYGPRFAADEEFLPVGEKCLDLIISCLSLHWVNDLPGALIQIKRALKPDGLFLGSYLGGETLKELRQALVAAEMEISGGAHPRVSPMADIRDGGALLQRAGFALPVADTDTVEVSYENPMKLMRDLRGMGEQMATSGRLKSFSRRDVMIRAADIYREMFGDENGRVPATFEIITLTGWAPSPDQQQPLAPGSGQANLGDVLE